MMNFLVRLSVLSFCLSCVMCTTSSSQSQLASLNERMNQMLSALYASPLLSKTSSSSTSAEEISTTSTSPDTSYIVTSGPPHVIYVSPSPYLEAGAQPNDYGYPTETHPVARSAWPYPYEYAYPQYSQPAFPSKSPYLEAPRQVYPQIPSSALNPSFSSSLPPVPYSPFSYPSGPISSPRSVPPMAYPVAPFSSGPLPYPPPMYTPVPQPQSYSPASPFLSAFPSSCSSPPYPLGYPALPSGYPAPTLPSSQYTGAGFSSPALPPSGFPSGYPSALPSPGFPSLSYPSPFYASSPYLPPAYPKYSEVLHHPFDFGK